VNINLNDERDDEQLLFYLNSVYFTSGRKACERTFQVKVARPDGDQVLLCTDGLTGMVRDERIAAILYDADSATTAYQTLIDPALAAGGSDNTTVVLARYRFPKSE
jgi:serine/threonine protein phosphatase PrpC